MARPKQPYKVCFHMSYPFMQNKRYHGKLHYTGYSLEEAIDKAMGRLARETSQGAYCTSMWLMRAPEKENGKNIKWLTYLRRKGMVRRWKALVRRAGENNLAFMNYLHENYGIRPIGYL